MNDIEPEACEGGTLHKWWLVEECSDPPRSDDDWAGWCEPSSCVKERLSGPDCATEALS